MKEKVLKFLKENYQDAKEVLAHRAWKFEFKDKNRSPETVFMNVFNLYEEVELFQHYIDSQGNEIERFIPLNTIELKFFDSLGYDVSPRSSRVVNQNIRDWFWNQ